MGERVLIVDDSKVARHGLERCLEAVGLGIDTVREAADGAAALAILERERVDLLCTDLAMPGMDGEELLRALRARPGGDRIPVIVIAGVATDSWRERLRPYGVAAVLPKPPEHAALLRVLRAIGLVAP